MLEVERLEVALLVYCGGRGVLLEEFPAIKRLDSAKNRRLSLTSGCPDTTGFTVDSEGCSGGGFCAFPLAATSVSVGFDFLDLAWGGHQ